MSVQYNDLWVTHKHIVHEPLPYIFMTLLGTEENTFRHILILNN